VEALAGVLFHMQAGDTDALGTPVGSRYLDPAMLGEWLVVLRDLVALGRSG